MKVAALRHTVGKDVTAVNQSVCLAIRKITNVKDGVKVCATNPWTHRTVAYSITASGTRVFVKKV